MGTENVARDYANPKIGRYENGYVQYDMAPEFDNEFSQYSSLRDDIGRARLRVADSGEYDR